MDVLETTSDSNLQNQLRDSLSPAKLDRKASDYLLDSLKSTLNAQNFDDSSAQNLIPSIDMSVIEPRPANLSTDSDCFKVYVRYRPLSQKERNSATPNKRLSIVKKEDQMVNLLQQFLLITR